MDRRTDGVVQEVNAVFLGRGVSLLSDDGRECNVNQLVFVDDTALVSDSQQRLRQLVERFRRVCEGRKLKVDERKIHAS